MTQRIAGFDLARALAIFGMVVVNFSIAVIDYDLQSAAWAEAFAESLYGRAAALFVILAGVGVSLMTRKALEDGDQNALAAKRRLLLKRAIILFVLGVGWMPIWAADILHFYAIYFLVALWLLNASDRQLWFWACAFMLIFIGLFLTFDFDAGWDWETLNNLAVWTPDGFVRNLFFNGFHPVFPWVSFMLIGMWFGRQDVRDPVFRRRVFLWALIIAGGVELLSGYLVRTISPQALDVAVGELDYILGSGPAPPLPFYMIAASATALVIIVLCIELAERFADSAWLKPLVSTGQLALTLYLAHVLIGMGLMLGFGLIESQTAEFGVYYALVFSVLAVIFSHTWRKRFSRGPLENIMRRLST
jgi:uncharacterized membrane protein YeiB